MGPPKIYFNIHFGNVLDTKVKCFAAFGGQFMIPKEEVT